MCACTALGVRRRLEAGCALGKYKHLLLAGASWSDYPLQTTCSDCPTGYYTYVEDKKTCTTCPTSYYQAAAGQSACTACLAGTYDDSTATAQTASVCKDCPVGYFIGDAGQTGCSECPQAYYQATAAQSICIGCIAGKYDDSATTQQTADACKDCDAGKFQSLIGQIACISCPTAYYQVIPLVHFGLEKNTYTLLMPIVDNRCQRYLHRLHCRQI